MADSEIEAMQALATSFSELDTETIGRVLRWASDKYGVASMPNSERDGAASHSDESTSAAAPEFQHFAELFNAAAPATKDQKVLVAGYWLQRLNNKPSFQAFELNRELKDLGHEVDHISEALSVNIRKKPALVLQLKKAGNTAQARKTYKLTTEGVGVVESMIAAKSLA